MNRCSSHVSAALVLIVFIIAPQFAFASTTWHVADETCEPPEGFIPIQTAEDLYAINEDLDGNYFLCNDIDLAGLNFEPIGPGNFTGVFEGNGNRILNLTMDHDDRTRVGFFATISGSVRNLTFVNPRVRNQLVSDFALTGVLAGHVAHYVYAPGVVENVHVTGRGYVEGWDHVGGLVGSSIGLIERSSVASPHIHVFGRFWVGGLVGAVRKGSPHALGTVNDSFSLAEVNGLSSVGGLAGSFAYASRAARSYAAGKVTGSGGAVGMFAGNAFGQIIQGYYHEAEILSSYAASLPGFEDLPFVEVCGVGNSCGIDDLSGLRTVEQMQTLNEPTTFVGWDFVNTWWHQSGHYPQLMEPILGDLNGDGVVDEHDLIIVLDNWGPCADCGDCPADITGSCTVNVDDLLIILNNWG